MSIDGIGKKTPEIHASAFVADQATVSGDVQLHEDTSVWPGTVLRGDNEPITIGAGSNVQEGAVLHADTGFPVLVESNVSMHTRRCCMAVPSRKDRW